MLLLQTHVVSFLCCYIFLYYVQSISKTKIWSKFGLFDSLTIFSLTKVLFVGMNYTPCLFKCMYMQKGNILKIELNVIKN